MKTKVLTPEQLGEVGKKGPNPELLDFLSKIPEGSGGQIELEADDNSRSIRIQLRQAAKELRKTLIFRDFPGRRNLIVFQVHGIQEK